MESVVKRIQAAKSTVAIEHFSHRLELETDCWDVHHAITNEKKDFVLLDVRGKQVFETGYVPTAVNLPHWEISEKTLAEYPEDTLFVVYCAGPHCNGAQKGALKLAQLGRPVKEMIGGAIGWVDEGFSLVTSDEAEDVT